MRVLGIDPGSSRIGYGLIEKGGGKSVSLITYGVLEIEGSTATEKMLGVGKKIKKLVKDLSPDMAAVEKIYFAKNQKTAMEVSQARGIILYLLLDKQIPVFEYGPNQIKLAVTGFGSTDKKGVGKMVRLILKTEAIKGPDDASDALAIAIAAAGENPSDK
jgi:crossover junction endodeoxyribonuclease RuvC